VGRFARGERIEVVTPRGVMEILASGQYHIDAGTTDSPTRFEVFNGRAELQRDGGNTRLASGQAALINADDAQSLTMASVEPDALDQWRSERERGSGGPPVNTANVPPPASATASYVSPEMTGADDLLPMAAGTPTRNTVRPGILRCTRRLGPYTYGRCLG